MNTLNFIRMNPQVFVSIVWIICYLLKYKDNFLNSVFNLILKGGLIYLIFHIFMFIFFKAFKFEDYIPTIRWIDIVNCLGIYVIFKLFNLNFKIFNLNKK